MANARTLAQRVKGPHFIKRVPIIANMGKSQIINGQKSNYVEAG